MNWFEVNVVHVDNDTNKVKRCIYLIESDTTEDAERRLKFILRNQTTPYAIQSIKKVVYEDVFVENINHLYYKVKVGFIVLDEVNGVEKIQYVHFLFGASNFNDVYIQVCNKFRDENYGFEISSIIETKYFSVYPQEQNRNDGESN